jgi:hypothetical protein
MKNIFSKWLFALVFAVTLAMGSSAAEARCVWVGAHWERGYYHHAHTVCYNNHVNAHCWWRHGHRVCPY